MGNEYFTIPYVTELEKKEGWNQDPNARKRYSVIRCHFLLRGPFQLDEPVRRGEVIGASTPLRGVTEKRVFTAEYQVTTVQVNESIKEELRESETIRSFTSALSASIGSDILGKISSEAKATASQRLLASFKETFKVSVSETHQEKKSITREYVIDPSNFERDTTLVFVKAYKAFTYKLYLQFIDYLIIEYKSSPRSLRLKRNKFPQVTTAKHPNILRIDLPLSSIRFWKEIPESSLLLEERFYRNEVEDPDEIRIEDLYDNKRYPIASMPPKPTLYDISERVFPRKIWK
jgi:hypothetical protein